MRSTAEFSQCKGGSGSTEARGGGRNAHELDPPAAARRALQLVGPPAVKVFALSAGSEFLSEESPPECGIAGERVPGDAGLQKVRSDARFDDSLKAGRARHATCFEVVQPEECERRMYAPATPGPMDLLAKRLDVYAPRRDQWDYVADFVLPAPGTTVREQELRANVFRLESVVVDQRNPPPSQPAAGASPDKYLRVLSSVHACWAFPRPPGNNGPP